MKMLKRVQKYSKYNKSGINWKTAPDIKKRVNILLDILGFDKSIKKYVYCLRSNGSKSNAYARIWGLSKIWQLTIGVPASYIIEVISEKFDDLPNKSQDKILLHEIAHIPKNFSGSLIPHYKRGKRKFSDLVKVYISKYYKNL